ncbi:hypothetical protein QR680_011396 [Steinernema hermaphroditum]|uniref:Uncharacterized protein n=1 Tax=Steinernema hermaphroditum TaxID=289476 RepID=A0AA39IS57_9BILA|nr:hypothetical protein QR680_011396 [Steinernema hermaphroditum]
MWASDSGECHSRRPLENDEWFDILNGTLKAILLEFRTGNSALPLFSKLIKDTNYLLHNEHPNIDMQGLLSLTAISTRLLASQIIQNPVLHASTSYLLRFVSLVFSAAGSTDVTFIYIEGVLEALPNFAKDTTKECLDAIQAVTLYTLSIPKLKIELYRPERKLIVGGVISVLVDVFSNNSTVSSLRTTAGKLICKMCEPHDARSTIAFLLPGICQAAVKVACSLDIKCYTITLVAVKVFIRVVTLVLGSEDIGEHDQKWMDQAVERVTQMIAKIICRLGVASDHRIREAALDSVCEIRDICLKRFATRIDSDYLSLLVNLSVDPYESISSKADSRLTLFREAENDFVIKYLTSRLFQLCSGLPHSVEKSLSGEPRVLERIYAALHALGKEDLERVIRCSSHFVAQFVDGLASVIRIDMNRLKLSSETDETLKMEAIYLYPLKYGITPDHLSNIAKEFMKTECSEIVFDHIVDRISADTYKKDKIGYFLIASCFLRTGRNAVSSYFDGTLKTLRKLVSSVEVDVKDEKIEDLQRQHSDDTCVAAIALTSLGEAIAQIDPQSEEFQIRMLDALYDVLQFCGSTNFVIKEASECALVKLSRNDSSTVSPLLLRFAPFIVHRLDVESRDFLSNRRSPLVLVELLQRCNDPALYEQVRFIVLDLLNVLDRFNQTWTMLILKGLLAFVQAILKWFPDMKPVVNTISCKKPTAGSEVVDSDDEEVDVDFDHIEENEKEEIPKPITSVVEILMRTKHMISSPFLPIRVLVLDILNTALRSVRYFENQLLPMVHQNWQGVVTRLKLPWGDISSEHLTVAAKAMTVVATMCELSGTFVYRKILDEMWPSVARYMEDAKKASRRNDRAFSHTAAFKYQLAVIKSCETFVIRMDLKTEEERKKIVNLLEMYAEDEAQNSNLREEAKRVLSAIREFK